MFGTKVGLQQPRQPLFVDRRNKKTASSMDEFHHGQVTTSERIVHMYILHAQLQYVLHIIYNYIYNFISVYIYTHMYIYIYIHHIHTYTSLCCSCHCSIFELPSFTLLLYCFNSHFFSLCRRIFCAAQVMNPKRSGSRWLLPSA